MDHSLIVLGATGAVGSQVVEAALGSPSFVKVTTIARRRIDRESPKLVQQVVDVFDAVSYEPSLALHDAAICTLGIGEPSRTSKEEFHRVDVECVERFAAACKRQGVLHFTLMTSVGANARSSVTYLRYKGEIEQKVRDLGFARTSLFRPSMLVTPKNRYGATQAVALAVFPKIEALLMGSLRRFRAIRVEEIGRAMVENVRRSSTEAVEIVEWDGIKALLGA